MDYIVITRQEYSDFHIAEHKGHHHTLSPDDLDMWAFQLSEEFDRLKAKTSKPSILKRIILAAKLVFN